MLDVVVIIISHGHGEVAVRAVESVYASPTPLTFALTAVENIADGFCDAVRRIDPTATAIRNAAPLGFATNVNRAIAAAQPNRYVLLLNPDTEVRRGMLERLVEFLDANPDAGIAGPTLLNLDGTRQGSARSFSTPSILLRRVLRLDRCFRHDGVMENYLGVNLPADRASDVDWVVGAVMLIRCSMIQAIGAMDERYFLYSEDQDWCCRAWRAGWRVCYVPAAVAVHAFGRAGMRRPWSAAGRHQLYSAFRMFRKFHWRLTREMTSCGGKSSTRTHDTTRVPS